MRPLRKEDGCIKLGSWRWLWLFSWQKYESFHYLSPLDPSEWAWRGACWHSPSCIPSCAVQLSWAASSLEFGPEQSPSALLPLHRADTKVTSPWQWKGLGWIESLHEKTPKLWYPLQCRICLNMLFMQNYWLAPTDPVWSHRNAMWGQTAGSMRICRVESAGQRGVSGTVSAPVPGCLWNEFTHDVANSFSCSNSNKETPSCFKQAAARVILLKRRKSNASCLTPASLSELSSYSPGESQFPNVHSV